MKTFQQFAEQAYSSSNSLNENILAKAVQFGIKNERTYAPRALSAVKGLFSKGKPKQIPSGQIGSLRLYQDKAKQSVDRLNQSVAASKANNATRAATRERNRLNNLDPRAVSDANKRREAVQIMQRNRAMGRPSWYNPNTPGSEAALKRYYADKRSGIKGLPE